MPKKRTCGDLRRTGFRVVLTSCVVLCILAFGVRGAAGDENPQPKVRVSAWYWLNSAPKAEWERDFKTMHRLGFTHVVLGWGLDAAGVATRKEETKQALQAAQRTGLGAYLIVWHPEANSLARKAEFMREDASGKPTEFFDLFNPEWRSTQWKGYLQELAKAYGPEAAMAGYVFDDSFSGVEDSTSRYERSILGSPAPKPTDPKYDELLKARQGWWEEWAKDTVGYIRAMDGNRAHEIYIEDYIGGLIHPQSLAHKGLDFNRVAQHFDAVGGYTTPHWTSAPDSDDKVSRATTEALEGVRKLVGPDKKLVFTFWSANFVEERKPGPAAYPSAAQIQRVCDDALKVGIRHVDMYGFRIGDYQATKEEKARMMPAEPAPYVLTKQFPQKFLWDRPEVHADLGRYLRGLNDADRVEK